MINCDDFIREQFDDYFESCYGFQKIHPGQKKEIEQAFLSGMNALNCSSPYPSIGLINAITSRMIKAEMLIGEG